MEAQHTGLDDCPNDCVLAVLTHFCSPRSVAMLSITCRRLHALATKESVWVHHCQRWLDEHHHCWENALLEGAERVSAHQLLSSLRLPSYRAMMTAFYKLGGSPVGLFHPARCQERSSLCPGLLYVTALQDQHRSSAGGGFLPCPHLIGCSIEWIEAADGSLKPRMNEVFRVALGPESPTAFTELEFPMVLPSLNLMGRLKHATAASLLAPVTASSSSTVASSSSAPASGPAPAQAAAAAAQAPAPPAGAAGSAQEEPDERPYWEVDPALLVNTRDLDVEFSACLRFSDSGRRMALEVHLEYTPPNQKPPRLRTLRKEVTFNFKRVVGLPGDEKLLLKSARPEVRPPSQTGSMQALLGELQGIWTALYGSHGAEVLQLKMSSDQGDVQDQRLEGQKLVGDPNVPSEETSFWVDPTKFAFGPYNGVAVASGSLDDRPVIASLPAAGFLLLNLHEREDVALRFAACGQINQEPSTWQPETEPAELILYSDEQGRIDLERFSVLWRPPEDNRVTLSVPPLLQLMDFQPLQLHERPRWLSRRQ